VPDDGHEPRSGDRLRERRQDRQGGLRIRQDDPRARAREEAHERRAAEGAARSDEHDPSRRQGPRRRVMAATISRRFKGGPVAGYYHMEDLAKFGEIGQGNKELADKFFDYYGAVFAEGALTAREKALIALGVAHAVQCPYCIDAYSKEC